LFKPEYVELYQDRYTPIISNHTHLLEYNREGKLVSSQFFDPALWISTIKVAILLPPASKKYVASALTFFTYFSILLKKFGSCTILFPSSVGILALIKNLMFQKEYAIIFIDIATHCYPLSPLLAAKNRTNSGIMMPCHFFLRL
jgi:hypothetical protein